MVKARGGAVAAREELVRLSDSKLSDVARAIALGQNVALRVRELGAHLRHSRLRELLPR